MRNQDLLWTYDELNTTKSLEIFQNCCCVLLRQSLCMEIYILGIGVDRSSKRGRFHISETEELIILFLRGRWGTICSKYGWVLPSIQSVSFVITHAPVGWLGKGVRVEGRKIEKSFVQTLFLIDETIHFLESQLNIIMLFLTLFLESIALLNTYLEPWQQQ